MIRLQTNMSNQLDQTYRSEDISNFKKIEFGVNELYGFLNKHQKQDIIAHKSNQITHGKTTVDKMLIYQMSRIRNLVLGSDVNSLKEVKDARVDNEGNEYPILSERLNAQYDKMTSRIDDVEKRFIEINFDEYEPDKTGQIGIANKLQHALNRLKDAKGGVLHIKNGDYLMDARVAVYSNTEIKMEKNVTLYRGWRGGFFDIGHKNDAYYGYEGVHNVQITGGTLDSNYENIDKFPTTELNFIQLRHNDNVSLTNIKFRNAISFHVTDINGSRNIKIRDCIFEGYIDLNGKGYKEAVQLSEYTDDSIGGAGYEDGTPTRDVVIDNCVFRKSDILDSFSVAIGNHLSRHNIWQKNFKIQNCVFEDIKDIAIRPYKWNNVKVLNNEFLRCNEGVRISSVNGNDISANDVNGVPSGQPQTGMLYTIEGNTFQDYKSKGITAYGNQYNDITARVTEINITNNFFVSDNNDVGEAIVLDLCASVHIKTNTIGRAYRGIRLIGCHTIVINSNYINNVKTEAIINEVSPYTGYSALCRHIYISDNIVNVTGRNGFYLQYMRNFFVKNNTISNTNDYNVDETRRGGIYGYELDAGDISGNMIWGDSKAFAIRIDDANNTVLFNNGGYGEVSINGTNSAKIGYWNVDINGEIYRRETKGLG